MSNIYLGIDVHQASITLAVLPAHAPAPTRVDQLPNDLPKLRRYLDRLAEGGTVLACYEASGAGYVLQRALASWGYPCVVIAPSLIPTKPGVQRKHDRYDAAQLARLFRAGELTAVRVPSDAEERMRDLVRCRETIQRELLQSKHYLVKFLAGSITKAGNSHCRHVLIQAAWSYRHRPKVAATLRARQREQPAPVIAHAWKAQHRLHALFQHLAYRKQPRVAVVAVVRELAGFL